MTTEAPHGAGTRQPLMLNGKAVRYGTQRQTKDGKTVYEFTGPRVNGKKPPRVTLKATTATDAMHEIERLTPLARDGKIGDGSMRLGPLFQAALAAMKTGEFTHSEGRYSERSIELFRQRAEDHVLRVLGHSTKVREVRVRDLRTMSKRLTAEGLGGSTVRGCLSCASALLRYATDLEIIESNPAHLLGVGDRPTSKRKSDPRYLSVAQVEQLFAKMSDDSRPVAVTMFWGALRVSEALALTWGDVKETVLDVAGTKTKASADTIPLHSRLASELATHRKRMGERGIQFIADDALVFQTRSGKPMHRRNVLRAVQVAADAAGLNPEGVEPIGCHDLRHSMVANALSVGMSITEASRLARHANPQVTATVYADLTQEGVEALGAKLAQLG